jgi:hypothetical protein
VDRIAPPVELGAGFIPRPPPDDDVAAYVTRSVSGGGYRFEARVVLGVPLAAAREKIPPAYGTLTALDARTCRLVTTGSSMDGTIFWLGMSGLPFTIEGPPELERRVGEIAERLRRRGGLRTQRGATARSAAGRSGAPARSTRRSRRPR